jgi:hypothetical protein
MMVLLLMLIAISLVVGGAAFFVEQDCLLSSFDVSPTYCVCVD